MKLKHFAKAGKLPPLPDDLVNIAIITGVEALGRGHDLQKLDTFIGGALASFGAEQVGQYVDLRQFFERRATALGIDAAGLVKSEETIQKEQQQQQNFALAQQGMNDAMRIKAQEKQPNG